MNDTELVINKTWIDKFFYTLLVAFVYFFSAKLVAPLALGESGSIFAIWPPTGVALSFLFFRGNSALPGIFIGAFFLNVTLSAPIIAAEIAIGNTFGPALSYWLMQRSNNELNKDIFYTTNTILLFILYSGAGALVTSAMGTSVLFWNGFLSGSHHLLGWAGWFLGDLIGFVLITPLVLGYTIQKSIRLTSSDGIYEVILISLVVVLIVFMVFGSGYFFEKRYPIAFLILFPLIWASARLSYNVNMIFLVIVAIGATVGTAMGYSQFAFDADQRISLVVLQIFILSVTFLVLMMIAQRRNEQRILDEMEHLSLHDSLTKVGNRRFFTTVFENELAKNKRYHHPLSLILFDIDHFKDINDTLGHAAGDKVLKELAALIEIQLRSSDALARWGGEEFIVVLPETDLANAAATAEKMRQCIEAYSFSIKEPIRCSFGVIECSEDESFENALIRVDCLLYEAKNSGRNKVMA